MKVIVQYQVTLAEIANLIRAKGVPLPESAVPLVPGDGDMVQCGLNDKIEFRFEEEQSLEGDSKLTYLSDVHKPKQ